MKTMIKNECNRAFRNKWFYVTLIICLSMIIYDLMVEVIPTRHAMNIYLNTSSYPIPNVYNRWMELNNSTASKLLHFIFPLLACLPYSMSIYSDIKSKYAYNIFVRINKRKYFLTKLIVQFLVSFSVVLFTMVVSFLLTAAILPIGTPFAGCQTYYVGGPLHIFGSLFYKHPLIVCIFIMLVQSIIFALISCLAYTFAYILNNGIMVITSAFTVYFFENVISPVFGNNYTMFNYSHILRWNNEAMIKILIELIIIVIILAITYGVRSNAKDEI